MLNNRNTEKGIFDSEKKAYEILMDYSRLACYELPIWSSK